jgi:hypothetical protein
MTGYSIHSYGVPTATVDGPMMGDSAHSCGVFDLTKIRICRTPYGCVSTNTFMSRQNPISSNPEHPYGILASTRTVFNSYKALIRGRSIHKRVYCPHSPIGYPSSLLDWQTFPRVIDHYYLTPLLDFGNPGADRSLGYPHHGAPAIHGPA